jgi:cytochrome b involved in lipid metabolism
MNLPLRDFIASVAREKLQNDAYFSEEFGFLPPSLPKTSMGDSHRAWDEYAAQIPELFFSQCTQRELEKMPLLSAAEGDLSWEHVSRASLLLSLLASAYWRHGIENFFSIRINDVSSYLPENILIPWLEVTKRLSRLNPFQSATDLFFNNFKFVEPSTEYKLENVLIENITMLVPSFGNQSERVFYMSFVEIHAVTSPILRSICEIQKHIKLDDAGSAEGIETELGNIKRCLQLATKTLLKINPNPTSPTYCDPILWAKTVAIFAVPPKFHQQGGTSGASTPIVHVMDAFLNRKSYKSFYGQYVKHEGKFLLPEIFKGYLEKIREVPLNVYLLAKSNPVERRRLVEAYNEVVDAYAGPAGFMGKHFSKVFNYLAVATMVGRNQSTSGHERYIPSETWVEVTHDLQLSAEERKFFPGPRKAQTAELQPPAERFGRFSDPAKKSPLTCLNVARHHYINDSWVILHGQAFDITPFIAKHPGGQAILQSYSGRDATRFFDLIPGHARVPDSLLQQFHVGAVETAAGEPGELETRWRELLDSLLKIYSILELQYTHQVEAHLKIYFNVQTHSHFLFDHLEFIILQILGLLDLSLIEGEPQRIIQRINEVRQGVNFADQDLRGADPESLLKKYAEGMELNQSSDLALVDALIGITLTELESGKIPNGLALWEPIGRWVETLEKRPILEKN